MTWDYILFDLDGTLTDSSEGIVRCVEYALEAGNHVIPEHEKLLEFIGPPLIEGFQEITGLSYEDSVIATAKYRERYETIGLYENKLYEGVEEVLSILKSHHKKICLATSKPEIFASKILEYFGIAIYFDEVVGSMLDGTRNAKKDVIKEVFARSCIEDKDKVVMVGDRRHDIIGAKSCGVRAIGVYYGFAKQGELEQAGADYVVENVNELPDLLLG